MAVPDSPDFDGEAYGQRRQVETVMYMLKVHQGSALSAREYQTRRREMGLMALTHNVMIVDEEKGFYRVIHDPLAVGMTVANLVKRYQSHADPYYNRPGGAPIHGATNIAHTVNALFESFGAVQTDEISPRVACDPSVTNGGSWLVPLVSVRFRTLT